MSQVILFDLDGTLTESGEGITKCVQYALEKMDIVENDLKKLESFIGPPLKDSFMKYGGFTEEQAVQAVAYYRERYETEGMFENRLYPKVADLLELLQINDKIMGVASSKPEQYVKQILEHFGIASYFKVVVGSEMNGAKVTKTEVIEEALARLQMQTERDKVVMVGDRAEDVQGALTCGIQCVGVLYGYGSEEELKQAGAVYLAEDVEDLAVLASPSDEETTEHVESIRQNDLKETDVVNTVEIEETEQSDDSEITEDTPSCEGEPTEVLQEETDTEENVGVPSEENQEVSVSDEREDVESEEQVDEEENVQIHENVQNQEKSESETGVTEKEPVQQAVTVSKRIVFDDDDDDFLEPALPRVKKSKVVKMHPIHHVWRWIYPMALYLIVSVAVTLCAGIYFAICLLLGEEAYNTQMFEQLILDSSLLQTMISGLLMALISWLLYRRDQKNRELGILGNGKEQKWCPMMLWLSVLLISIAGCQLMNDVIEIAGLHELFPTYSNVADQTIYNQSSWVILLTVCVAAPLSEELIFRGLLFHRMKDWMKPWLAVILSAVLFGAYHGNMVQFSYAFVMGMVFAIVYHRTGTLWTAIVAHVIANMWSVLGYGHVNEYAQTIEYGSWIVIGVSAVLFLIPLFWLSICKRK